MVLASLKPPQEPTLRLLNVPGHRCGCGFSVALAQRIENRSVLDDGDGRLDGGDGRYACVEVQAVEMQVCVEPLECLLEKHIAACLCEDIMEHSVCNSYLPVFLIGLSNLHLPHRQH